MARQLWLLRHGEAVPHDSRASDDERELTPRGRLQAAAAGTALSKLGLELAGCFTSPKVRARDTAQIACEALGVSPVVEEALSDGFGVDAAHELLAAHDDGESLLAVGHNPDLAQIVHDLTGARVELEKGGVAAVEVDGRRGTLIVLLRPRELESLGVTD